MARNDSNTTAVVTIDIQRDYFPGGAFPLHRAGKALARTRMLLEAARKHGIPVLHVMHESLSPDAGFLIKGSAGTELHPGLGIPADGSEPVVRKNFPDSFLGTELEARLDAWGVERVVWAGMITWMCVDTTVRSSRALGYENVLVEDACASGWMLKGGLPVLPWESQRAFMAALGYHHARLTKSRVIDFTAFS